MSPDISKQLSAFVDAFFSPDSVERNAALNTRLDPNVVYSFYPIVKIKGSSKFKHYMQLMSLFHESYEVKTIVHEEADQSGQSRAVVDLSVTLVPFSIFKVLLVTLPFHLDMALDSSSTNAVDDEKNPGWLIKDIKASGPSVPLPSFIASIISIFTPLVSLIPPFLGALILHSLYLYNHYLVPSPNPRIPYILNFRWFISQILFFTVSTILYFVNKAASLTSGFSFEFVIDAPEAHAGDSHLSTLKPSKEKPPKASFAYKPKAPHPPKASTKPTPPVEAGTVSYASAVAEGPVPTHHTFTGSNGGHPKEVHVDQTKVPDVEAGTVSYAKAVEEGERSEHHAE